MKKQFSKKGVGANLARFVLIEVITLAAICIFSGIGSSATAGLGFVARAAGTAAGSQRRAKGEDCGGTCLSGGI